MPHMRGLLACILVTLVSACHSAARQVAGELALPAYGPKEDILDLKNTDRITCEIQGLLHGLLTVKTDSMGTLSVEWVDVVGLQSRFKFRVETKERKTWFGSLSRSTEPGKLIVDQDGFQVILDMLDIVLIEKIEATFLDRVKGYINFGFNYSEATRITQSSLGAGLNYKSRWNVLSADFSAIASDFFIDLKFYLSYDSSPPSAAASTRDHGIITSLGYSW